MPPDLAAAYADLLQNGQDPDAMDQVAVQLERYGFAVEAQQLRARAAQIRASRPTPQQPVQPGPPKGQVTPPPQVTPTLPPGWLPPGLNLPPGLQIPGNLIPGNLIPIGPTPVQPASGGYAYNPNLGSVGSGPTYSPGPVSGDAGALNYLGYNAGSPGPEQNPNSGPKPISVASGGAWDPTFQSAVTSFQSANGLGADGWIGPGTRTKLKALVDAKNARGGGTTPAQVIPANWNPMAAPPPPAGGTIPLVYIPNTAAVGSGASYEPGPVDQDAAALRFLGFNPGNPGPQVGHGPGATGGAFDLAFKAAVLQFQVQNGLAADGWIGPGTRTKLGQAVNAKNLSLGGGLGGLLGNLTTTSGSGKGQSPGRRSATVMSPSGLRLRSQPHGAAPTLNLIPANGTVQVLKVMPGPKAEAVSPGRVGGWALVDYASQRGWIPAEWIRLDPPSPQTGYSRRRRARA